MVIGTCFPSAFCLNELIKYSGKRNIVTVFTVGLVFLWTLRAAQVNLFGSLNYVNRTIAFRRLNEEIYNNTPKKGNIVVVSKAFGLQGKIITFWLGLKGKKKVGVYLYEPFGNTKNHHICKDISELENKVKIDVIAYVNSAKRFINKVKKKNWYNNKRFKTEKIREKQYYLSLRKISVVEIYYSYKIDIANTEK
jgi:hypothetical protein